MADRIVDMNTWPRADQFRFFRGYERPHYAITSRLDVSRVIAARAQGVSSYRACLYAIGAGLNYVPELRMRFQDDVVVEYDSLSLSMPVPQPQGSFVYCYVPWQPDFGRFDAECMALIAQAETADGLNPNTDTTGAVAYLSCLPWMDFTSLNNALPDRNDCIPRVSWGKFVNQAGRWDMAMTIEVHHALVDGAQVGAFFERVQSCLGEF